MGEEDGELKISYSPGLEAWLHEQRLSLAFATPPAKLFLIGLDEDGHLSAFERTFNKCTGWRHRDPGRSTGAPASPHLSPQPTG